MWHTIQWFWESISLYIFKDTQGLEAEPREGLAMISAMGGCFLIDVLSSLQSSLQCESWLIKKKKMNRFPIRQTEAPRPIYFTPDQCIQDRPFTFSGAEVVSMAFHESTICHCASLEHTHTHLFQNVCHYTTSLSSAVSIFHTLILHIIGDRVHAIHMCTDVF